MAQRVWLDGVETASLDWSLAGGRGLFAGSRVMTTLLSMGRRVVELERHLERLIDHKERFGITEEISLDVLRFDIERCTLDQKAHEWARIRVVLFPDGNQKVRRLVAITSESAAEIQKKNKMGQTLQMVRDQAWQKGSHLKTGLIGTRETQILRAQSAGFDDVLWVNGDGELAEATWGNVFLIGRTGDLVEIATPPPASGILEGITRRRVTELLQKAKIPVTERIITEDEIPRFDEAFTTSSVQGIVPLTQIGGHRLHTLRPNAVFGHIARLYSTWLGLDGSSDSKGLDLN